MVAFFPALPSLRTGTTRPSEDTAVCKNLSVAALMLLMALPATGQEPEAEPVAEPPVLTVYTYDSFASEWGPGPRVEEAFEAECACDLRFVTVDSSTGILSRVQLEGENSPADVVLGLDNSLVVEAQNTGLMAPHELNTGILDLPQTWDNPNFLPFDFGFFAFIYDSEQLDDPPSSFEELLSMEENFRIVIQDPRSSTPGLGLLLWIKSLYGDQAQATWKKLAPRILTVTKGWSEAYGMFLEGEADMVLSYTTSPAYHQIVEEETRYRAAGFKEGHGIQIEVAGMLKNASNPELARQFLGFILTPPFQSLIPTGNWMYPVVFPEEGLPEAFAGLVRPVRSLMIDPQGIAENKLDWIDEFNQALSQ
jgi:thiamine transport system substrate-binding protein